jgi:hypothetical protein
MEKFFENLWVIMENNGVNTKAVELVQGTVDTSNTVDDLMRERPNSEFWSEPVPDTWLMPSHVEDDRWDD